MAEGPLRAVRLECWWSPAYENHNPRALLVRLAGRVVNHDEEHGGRFSERLAASHFQLSTRDIRPTISLLMCQSGQRWSPKLRRGPECMRQNGTPVAAINDSVGGRDLQAA